MTRATVPPLPSRDPVAVPVLVATALRAAQARLEEAGIATARQDAETLLGRALGWTRLDLHVEGRQAVPEVAGAAFEAFLGRRARQEPLQYLLGEADFCGLALRVGPGVFVPRPETEELVGRALGLGPTGPATVVDLCAGSGAIACALAARRPGWTVWAVERAPAALAYARENARRLGLAPRVPVLAGDLFAPLVTRVPAGGVDLLVANPPYLAAPILPALPVEVRDWEPRESLDGGPDGLDVIRRLLADAPVWLRPGGALLVEIGREHGPAVLALAGADPRYGEARVHRDFRGLDRIFEARRR